MNDAQHLIMTKKTQMIYDANECLEKCYQRIRTFGVLLLSSFMNHQTL